MKRIKKKYLTPSHQIFHVATFVQLAWGTERGADRTLVGAWIPPFINLYRFQSTSSGVFGLLDLCVLDTANIYDNEALSFEPQISIFRNTEFIVRMQWTFNPLCSSVDFIHSRPAQRSVPRPHCSTRSVECRCHLDRMEISNHGVSIEIPGPFVLYDVFTVVAIKRKHRLDVKRCTQMQFTFFLHHESFSPRTSDSYRLILKWKRQKRKVHWQIECALKLSVKTAETRNWFGMFSFLICGLRRPLHCRVPAK